MTFIDTLRLIKEKSCGLMLALHLFLILFFFFSFMGCGVSKKVTSQAFHITDEERNWLKEFFRDLLLDHPGAYTLYGSKPISSKCIYFYSEEDKERKRKELELFSPEEKAKLGLSYPLYDFDANYEKWKKIKCRFPIRNFLFGEFPSPYVENVDIVFFVNIEMTLKTLLKYYEDFRRVIGYDFDPLQVIFEVENRDSLFWNAVVKSHALRGILYGFGRKNAWFFEWEIAHRETQNRVGDFIRSIPLIVSEIHNIENYDPQHFSLPVFGIFGADSNKKLLEKYKKEQKRIRTLYKGRDEVDVALEWLTR